MKIRYALAFIVVFGILIAIFSDENVRTNLMHFGQRVNQVVDIYPNQSCEKPIAYRLGDVDERFGLTEDKIRALSLEAEKIWEEASGRDLFILDQNNESAVTINFIFDERQQSIIDARKSEDTLESQWQSFDLLTDKYDEISAQYKIEVEQYESDIKEYEEFLDEFNKSVEDWNENGGSQKEYKSIKDKEFFIKTVFRGLEENRKKLNDKAEQINQLAEQINQLQKNLSRKTDLHNRQFATDEIVDIGEFGFYDINIYQYYSIADLRLTLTHEMGHALGIDHVDDNEAVMYYLLEDQYVNDLVLKDADLEALEAICAN